MEPAIAAVFEELTHLTQQKLQAAVEPHLAAHKQGLERREQELDRRQQELEAWEQQLRSREQNVVERERALPARKRLRLEWEKFDMPNIGDIVKPADGTADKWTSEFTLPAGRWAKVVQIDGDGDFKLRSGSNLSPWMLHKKYPVVISICFHYILREDFIGVLESLQCTSV